MKKISAKRLMMMLVSMLPIALGVTMFSLSGLGNDPYSGMNMAVGATIGLSFGTWQLILNSILLALVVVFERSFIHIGTFVNMISVGFLVDSMRSVWFTFFAQPQNMGFRLILSVLGVIALAFGASLYFTADAGVAPYDGITFILRDHTPLSYATSRTLVDCICVAVSFAFGGVIGIGTLISAFGVGPCVAFFNRNFSEKLLKEETRK